jgi:Lauroyl/myristoyl acyltransferase
MDFPSLQFSKRQPDPQYTLFMNKYRQMIGIEVIARGSIQLVGVARALKQGKILGFLADQDVGPNGIFLQFLNKAASTPLGPAIFAKRFRSPILPAFIVRRAGGGHRLIIHSPLYYADTGNKDADLYKLTAKLNKITAGNNTEIP